MRRRRYVTASNSSPVGGRRGCLCRDGRTYSRKCCDGSLLAQGIGSISLVEDTSNFWENINRNWEAEDNNWDLS
jgi:hypothetical protein